MARIDANQVEEQLRLASDEVSQERSDQTRFESLVAAFRRAAELRDKPFFVAAVKGRKNGRIQHVRVTHETRAGLGGLYYRCLVPYTDTQVANQRGPAGLLWRRFNQVHTTRKRPEVGADKQAVAELLFAGPVYFHDQWVREDRLEKL